MKIDINEKFKEITTDQYNLNEKISSLRKQIEEGLREKNNYFDNIFVNVSKDKVVGSYNYLTVVLIKGNKKILISIPGGSIELIGFLQVEFVAKAIKLLKEVFGEKWE